MKKWAPTYALLASALLLSNTVYGDNTPVDPEDPFASSFSDIFNIDSTEDAKKSPEDLLFEARVLLQDERPLDARTKLLLVLQKDPGNVEAHLLLGGYYMADVGHFRLALKYAKQALRLFTRQEGEPPYSAQEQQQQHASILYLLAQVRLNLDDYQGALTTLDTFNSFGYYSSWYPGTRAWVLMKLGRLDEAIQVARMGTLLGSEPGRTLNMLGILLSMKGENETALDVLRKATAYELSLGKSGQPATPLNNSGEVYNEIFAEDQAESSWTKATGMPDGCEHVLPSLNLATLYIDQLNLTAAARTISNFESCVAQFPLRNGEEHRSLVHLIRGRIALHRGLTEKAIEHFTASLSGRQWFGKIGTDQEDLDAGARISLAQALRAQNNRLSLTPAESIFDSAARLYQRTQNSLRAWWTARRARQILSEELNGIEDLTIRNTDSLIEYPTLGELLAQIPLPILKRRVALEDSGDSRIGSEPFYLSYLAAAESAQGSRSQAEPLIQQALNKTRPEKDVLLRMYLNLLELGFQTEGSDRYNQIALRVFSTLRPALRSYGFRLPVQGKSLSPEATTVLYDSGFIVVSGAQSPYTVSHRQEKGEEVLELTANGGVIGDVTVRGGSLVVVGKKLTDLVSTIEDNQS